MRFVMRTSGTSQAKGRFAGWQGAEKALSTICTGTEQSIRRTLERIARRFSASSATVDYSFIFHRLDAPMNARNWTAAATASVPWKADRIAEYQAALDAICGRIRLMD
jgi:hypothetical protein